MPKITINEIDKSTPSVPSIDEVVIYIPGTTNITGDLEKGKPTLFTKDKIDKWIEVFYRRFYSQQFKRSCLPDGVKIGSVGLSPRGDWIMPSDAVLE